MSNIESERYEQHFTVRLGGNSGWQKDAFKAALDRQAAFPEPAKVSLNGTVMQSPHSNDIGPLFPHIKNARTLDLFPSLKIRARPIFPRYKNTRTGASRRGDCNP
jgi:hypothetical protein